jgi:hypothetical protein
MNQSDIDLPEDIIALMTPEERERYSQVEQDILEADRAFNELKQKILTHSWTDDEIIALAIAWTACKEPIIADLPENIRAAARDWLRTASAHLTPGEVYHFTQLRERKINAYSIQEEILNALVSRTEPKKRS